jgi:hypothetical protein
VKRIAFFLVAALAMSSFVGVGSWHSKQVQAAAASPLDQLLPLVGEWEGTSDRGGAIKLTYTLTAGGTALMEKLTPAGEAEMLTIYTAAGDHLRITHYCNSGNQPEMETAAIKGTAKEFWFAVTSVNGMRSAEEGHMINLVLKMIDRDHITQQWTYLENGKKQTEILKYTRKS